MSSGGLMVATMRRAGRRPAWALSVLTAGLCLGLVAAGSPASAAPAAGPPRHGADFSLARHRIKHVIEIMLENHTFDDLFPAWTGRRTVGGHASPVLAPRNEGDVQGGIDNSRTAELAAMDAAGTAYRMDGYTRPPFGVSAITSFGGWADPDLQYLARTYELGTRNFQPAIAPTRPNIMMALNGTAHGWYYNRRNPHPRPWYSIFKELTAAGRSWKIYVAVPQRVLRGSRWYQLTPPGHRGDVTVAGHFFSDLAHGRLPAFSFVRPGFGYSQEPREDIGEGDTWLGQVVAAVAHSRYWHSTAIFITYDEGGGFWDHLAPAVSSGYGTRTPLVIVSPWARRGVLRQQTTNISILSFMQRLWRMRPLTPLNAAQNDLWAAFRLRQRPLPRPRLPVAPRVTIGFHGRTLISQPRALYPKAPLRLYLDAENRGLGLDPAAHGRLTLSVTPPGGVKMRRFPPRTMLVHGRAMVRVRFPAPGYYRIRAGGPHGSVGWTTVVVLRRGQRLAPGDWGLSRDTF